MWRTKRVQCSTSAAYDTFEAAHSPAHSFKNASCQPLYQGSVSVSTSSCELREIKKLIVQGIDKWGIEYNHLRCISVAGELLTLYLPTTQCQSCHWEMPWSYRSLGSWSNQGHTPTGRSGSQLATGTCTCGSCTRWNQAPRSRRRCRADDWEARVRSRYYRAQHRAAKCRTCSLIVRDVLA